MTVSKPRFCGNSAPTFCVSLQTLTQRRHLMHLPVVAHQGRRRRVDPLAGSSRRRRRSRGCPARPPGPATRSPRCGRRSGSRRCARRAAVRRRFAGRRGRGRVLVWTFMPSADRHRAGGGEVLRALDLDDADAAGADRLQALDVAERRDLDARLGRGVQDRRILGHFDRDVVDGQGDHRPVVLGLSTLHRCGVVGDAGADGLAAFSVVAAQAALRLADGHGLAPGLFDFVEVVLAPFDGNEHELLARRVGRVGVGVERGVDRRDRRARRRGSRRSGTRRCPPPPVRPPPPPRRPTTGPVTASPPAKIHFSEVWPVTGLILRKALLRTSRARLSENLCGVERLADGGQDLVGLDAERLAALFRPAAARLGRTRPAASAGTSRRRPSCSR